MSANVERPDQRPSRRGLVFFAGFAAVACIVGFLVWQARDRRKLDDCERLTAELNEAVGYLESRQFAKADQALSVLAGKFPKEPATVRNLAICRMLALLDSKAEETEGLIPKAQAAIDAAQRLEPASPIPHILAGRLASHLQNLELAAAAFEEAARLAPDDPTVLYDFYYFVGSASNDDGLRRKARQALAIALTLAPANAYLLKEELVARATEENPEVLATVKTLREQIAPIVELVRMHARSDVDEMARQLTDAVEAAKWPQVLARARMIGNVIKGEEWVRSDLRRLNRHPLSHIALGFTAAVCGSSPAPVRDEPRLSVELRPVPASRQLPDLAGVRDLNLSDVDLDGLIDVIALTERELTVLARTEADGAWQDLLTVAVREPMRGMLVADLDRDVKFSAKPVAERIKAAREANAAAPGKMTCQEGDVEVLAFGPSGVQLFRNDVDEQGKRTLSPVELNEDLEALRDVRAGVLADIDHDGDLDLILSAGTGVSVWLNEGSLKFEEATARSALPPQGLAATTLVAVDWDRDLDIDILLSGPGDVPAGWLENLRHGSLRWRPFESELDRLTGSTSLSLVEIDGNVSWDLVGAGKQGLRLVRTRTDSPGDVKSIDVADLSKEPFTGSLIGDFDNDTHPDLVAWGEGGVRLFWGTADGRLVPSQGTMKPPVTSASACAAGDLDGDGDLDLVIARADGLILYDNDGGNRNHWLAVRAQGEDGDKENTGDVNHLGIGSVLEIKAGRRYQAHVITGQVTHFGLGKKTAADVLRVIWTNGVPQPAVGPTADTSLCRIHVIGTSCPYFYTWNGSGFEFCTDACWAAPLGLQLAEGVFAQPRAWEYLTIPGERLRPKDGQYLIQMTEELWEATYLDQIELIVVDHPADVAIFSNEKVGPPELAEFGIHTVRNRKLPVAARDKHGRDVLEAVSREDGLFMKGFDAAPRRGLTDEHSLELDLGLPTKPRRATLFLTGWLFPASTSLRVGVSQDRSAPAPRPPALEVPDAEGNWQVVRPFMGFPGGRTKTIAVDLNDVFLTDDCRLRIVTNMEFYWDAAFFSIDEEPAPLELTHLGVASADLHYRGYSAILPHPGFGPDGYDYGRVGTEPKWAPMAGRFTRYGDVTELLRKDDDLQVIFGSGDEITVAFQVPEHGPRTGWKRDFILHNVGWDKDNDLNVVTSQMVEPLPFNGMSGYPYRADEQFPDKPQHREYLRKYQTREQFPMQFWREVWRSGGGR